MNKQTIESLDPRISRAQLPTEVDHIPQYEVLDQFVTYEVFQQQKSGGHFIHVGSVHAPNEEIALLFAKEQYGRRGKSVGMWIAPTNAIVSIPEEDVDMFDATPEKKYREVGAYMVRNRVEQYKKDNRNE
ncbi:MAG: hypothetical protein JNL36_05665 [Candidatus Kapabacteria bacterium]|nr:hypothetical protein [Candidatus Kapabacteria bacterium]